MADRNKIARVLSDAELKDFLEACYRTPDLTLAKVQAMAAERGIEVSLMGAKSFRDATYERYKQRLQHAARLAQEVERISDGGADGQTFAEAAGGLLGQSLFELLASEDLDLRDADALKSAERMGKMIARLRSGDQRAKVLEMKVREFELAEAERVKRIEAMERQLAQEMEGAKDGKALSMETLERIEKQLKLL